MPKYYFNVRDRRGLSIDDEGSSFAFLGEVLEEAKASARDLAKQLLDSLARIDDSCIEVPDGDGKVLAALPVSEALKAPELSEIQ